MSPDTFPLLPYYSRVNWGEWVKSTGAIDGKFRGVWPFTQNGPNEIDHDTVLAGTSSFDFRAVAEGSAARRVTVML